jgi:hypothetical protein
MAIDYLADHGTHYFVPSGNTRRRRRVQRFLCVGGPLAGQARSFEELNEQFGPYNWRDGPYAPFNNAGTSKHKMVFISKELLP